MNFIVPAFSVLNTRKGYWIKRQILWKSLGIKSELGREIKSGGNYRVDYGVYTGAVSIFDPVLCEIMYKWFCPNNGTILDPFAGGSVRGFVATKCAYQYTGIELRKKQVESNRNQCNATYHIGDSQLILDTIKQNFDFIFSCPPYYNLEVYSDLPGELSNIDTYENFLVKYNSIIKKSCDKLKDNRFACIVISNMRDKNGYYHNFVGDTIEIFKKCEMNLYNDMVLINSLGTLPIRSKKHFISSRKVGKAHQNVLVFFKGNKIEPIEEIEPYHFYENLNDWEN